MEQLTPRALADLYALLSEENKTIFQSLIAGSLKAEAIGHLFEQMPKAEQRRWVDAMYRQFRAGMFPVVFAEAVRAARENPDASLDELQEMARSRLEKLYLTAKETQAAELKRARDPKKRKMERDAEIIRLAKEGKTSGEIHRDIKAKWPCTSGAVNQVIVRAKRDGHLPK